MNALTARMRAPRTLRSHLVRVLTPRLVVFGALSSALLVGQAMSLSPSASPLEQTLPTVPTWSAEDRAAEPGCVPAADWPEGKPGAAVVVHRYSDGSVERVPFLDAWRENHNGSEVDDVWVLGVCP